jgi:hypothetical protein
MSAAWDGCKYMEARYDITTEEGEVRCVEQAWYAAKLEKKIAALHDRTMDWRELLEKLNADDKLCVFGRLEQQALQGAARVARANGAVYGAPRRGSLL